MDFQDEWIELLKNPPAKSFTLKVLVFRIGHDLLGIESVALKAVTEKKVVHSLPFVKQPLSGVANFRGDLKPVVNLGFLIEKKASSIPESGFMILISQENEDWVFIVDEVLGLFDILPQDLQNVPASVPGSLIKGMVNIGEKSVAILEEELLFYTLARETNA